MNRQLSKIDLSKPLGSLRFSSALLVWVLSAFLVSVAHAKTELVEQTATGYGDSYQEALAAALFNAVMQERGTTVGSEKQLRLDLLRVFEEDRTTVSASVGVEQKIFSLSKGWVDSYKVKSSQKPKSAADAWQVTVVANVPVHKSLIKDQGRQSIAVMPFRFTHSTFAINDLGQPSNAFQISSRIRDRILSSITQTQQLVALNRSYGAEFASEKALLSSDNVPASEAARIGNVVGADYMVVGNIHDLSTKVETDTFYGMTKTKVTDRVDMSYQVIEVATQKLLWADTVSTSFERDQKSDDNNITATIDLVAKLVVSGVMDLLFPIKVLDVAGSDEIYLNQGKARVSEDDVFALFTEGRTMRDPDTGVEIKIDGKKVAELTATSVSAKYSIAKLTDGDIAKIKKGDIVRVLHMEKADINKNKEVRETPGSSEAPVNWY